MLIALQILAALVTVSFVYWWRNFRKYEKKYGWISKAPGYPFFGNLFDIKNSTETLKTLSKLLKGTDGICFINLMVKNILVITNVEVLEFILTSTELLNKSVQYRYLSRWFGNGLLTANGKDKRWENSRKIITPVFHYSILHKCIPVYEFNSDTMIKLLEEELEKDSVDIYPYITMCSLDILHETSMGVSVNAQTNKYSQYVHAFQEMCRLVHDRSFSLLGQVDLLYPLTGNYYKELKYVQILHSHTKSIIESRREETDNFFNKNKNEEGIRSADNHDSFLDILLQSKADGELLPDWYIVEEINTLMFTGHNTTASAISFAMRCLAENPEVQVQAVEEQKTIFGNNIYRPVTSNDIDQMKYLELVIKETLRLYPPAPLYARSSKTDIEYREGKMLPKYTPFILFVYGLHRDPKVFPDPDKFNPKRFETMDKSLPFVFLPFSAGPRNCVGQNFAMQQMKAVLSKILRSYELMPATPKHSIVLAAEAVLKSANGIKIQIRRRIWS